jgi:uroporphyrinogen-III synthase
MPYAVITRDREGTTAYVPVLRTLGLDAIAMPVTRTEPMHENLRRALAAAQPYDEVACASARAATALAATRGSVTLPTVWAVGPATAQVLTDAGIAVRLEPTVVDAVSLANAMIAAKPVQGVRILVPRAEGGRDELVDLLREAGASVEAVAAYRTAPTATTAPVLEQGRTLFAKGQVAVCAVFAPSQVAALGTHVRFRTTDTLFAAIGETTAQALRDAGAKRIVVATEPTPEGLAKIIATVYPTQR